MIVLLVAVGFFKGREAALPFALKNSDSNLQPLKANPLGLTPSEGHTWS